MTRANWPVGARGWPVGGLAIGVLRKASPAFGCAMPIERHAPRPDRPKIAQHLAPVPRPRPQQGKNAGLPGGPPRTAAARLLLVQVVELRPPPHGFPVVHLGPPHLAVHLSKGPRGRQSMACARARVCKCVPARVSSLCEACVRMRGACSNRGQGAHWPGELFRGHARALYSRRMRSTQQPWPVGAHRPGERFAGRRAPCTRAACARRICRGAAPPCR